MAPLNPARVPTIYTTTVPAPKTCLGIAYGNSESILSYVASTFRDSASELESMSRDKDFGMARFKDSMFSGDTNIVSPRGDMTFKKI